MEQDKEPRMIRLADLAEKLVKVSAVLGAFGYMSLRAHLNYLGISSTSSLGVERYLMETYHLVGTIFLPLFLIMLSCVIALVIIYPIGIAVMKSRRIKLAAQSLGEYFSKKSSTTWMPLLLVVLLLLVYVWMFRVLTKSGSDTDVVVGKLVIERLKHSDADWFFYLVCVVCVTGYSIYSKYSVKDKRRAHVDVSKLRRFLWTGFAFALALLALQLPILYGRIVRSTDYPVAQVQFDNTESHTICGILVLDTSSDLTLWRAEGGIGQLIVIPHSRVQLISTGGIVDLLEAARAGASDAGATKPDCSDLFSPQRTPLK